MELQNVENRLQMSTGFIQQKFETELDSSQMLQASTFVNRVQINNNSM